MKPIRLVRLAIVLGAVACIAAVFSLVADFSDALVRASTPIGVAFSGVAGVVAGAVVARSFLGGAAAGALAGFTNALVGIAIAVVLRDAGAAVMAAGCLGGAILGAITGVLGHLLVTVIRKRGVS